ncbi:MAG TPA: hypothetical protein VNZ49_17585 [Bacteroidia bacterium]|jgi:hypothetical protein|nr:hypothetical protein [Bacteroidia bacterium]
MDSFGDILFKRISSSRIMLFTQGEMAQLTYLSFEGYIELIKDTPNQTIKISYPIGYKPDRTPLNHTQDYSKAELISRYQYLGLTLLPVNGVYQLVTIIETLLGDILKETLKVYPVKIPNKRKVDAEIVLGASSLDEIKNTIINSIINELTYKSPKDFAEEFHKYVGVNLLEKPAFHRYIELKATRDVYIHNSGIASDIYLGKADTLARVKPGDFLPVDIQYFLESYESCLQITEILEVELNKTWPSLEYQKSKNQNTVQEEKELAIEKIIEHAEELKEIKAVRVSKTKRHDKGKTKKNNQG